MDYHVIWYLLVGFLLMGYAILDGFDLGVGILHLFSRGDHHRRILLNSIGPVWDGNEVWLITAGGALFAAFPNVYATAFSAFYLPFMLLLVALIFRAVSIEFRSKEPSQRWRRTWDIGFSVGSMLAAFLYGVAIGNAVIGFPIGSDMEYQGTLLDLLSPYAILAGLFNLSMFAMHGAIYLYIKTEGDLQVQVRTWIKRSYIIFIILLVLLTTYTLYLHPDMIANFSFGRLSLPGAMHPLVTNNPTVISIFAWSVVLLTTLAIINISRTLALDKPQQMFISSASAIGAVILLFALGLFPNLMVSSLSPEYNLDIYNGASSLTTLRTMFRVAIFGLPFVATYTIIIYRTYRGKTILDEHSY